jgi:hypothetical protein
MSRADPPGASVQGHGDAWAFHDAVAAAAGRAWQAAGALDRDYTIGGHVVRLRFAGPGLVSALTPALAHLAIPAGAQPALTVELWDSESTGVEPPPPAWPLEAFQGSGAIQAFGADDVHITFQLGSSVLGLTNLRDNRAFYWVRAAARLPSYELGAPLRWILHLWLRRRGVISVHAGAVGRPEGGVLIVGRGGSGKSNTCLAVLDSDLLYAADDYCLVAAEPAPTIFSLYATGKTHAADLARLPFLPGRAHGPQPDEGEKHLFFLHAHFAHKLVRAMPARAVIAPRITGRPASHAHLTTPAAGMAALTPSTLSQLPNIQAEDFQVLARFFRRVPSYVLELGTDRREIMNVLTRLVGALNRGERPARVPA